MKSYDLHTHLFTTWERGRFSLERTPRDIDLIIDSPMRILSIAKFIFFLYFAIL